jgi:hypothetical protein
MTDKVYLWVHKDTLKELDDETLDSGILGQDGFMLDTEKNARFRACDFDKWVAYERVPEKYESGEKK